MKLLMFWTEWEIRLRHLTDLMYESLPTPRASMIYFMLELVVNSGKLAMAFKFTPSLGGLFIVISFVNFIDKINKNYFRDEPKNLNKKSFSAHLDFNSYSAQNSQSNQEIEW